MLIYTYTSTNTGNAASRNSSRQLGGNNNCTWARVPCGNGISNDRCVGNANFCKFAVWCGLVSYNIRTNRFVLALCTPVILSMSYIELV